MGSVLKRHMQLLEMEQSRERPLSSWRHWSIMPTGKDESCDYAAWRTEGLEEMSSRCTNIWKLRCKENRPRLFPVVPTDRARANTHRLKHSRFLLDIRKHNFMVTVSMHGNRFPCVVMESTSVDATHKLSGHGPDQLSPGEPASAERPEKMISRRPNNNHSVILWKCSLCWRQILGETKQMHK